MAKVNPLIWRNNCALFETISNFFIRPFVGKVTSILLVRRFGQQKSPPFGRKDRQSRGAGNGNRTRMASLEGWNFTIKLCPRGQVPVRLGVNCRGRAPLPSDFSRRRGRVCYFGD